MQPFFIVSSISNNELQALDVLLRPASGLSRNPGRYNIAWFAIE